LQITINSNTATYLTDDRPNAELRYRARFYFDPNTIVMASGNAHYIFYGYSGSTVVLRLEFRKSSSIYQLRAELVNDSSTWKTSNWFTISDAPHFVELDWQKATASGANNGSLMLWIDGVQQTPLTAVDNDTRRIDQVRLGPVSGIDSGTRGTYFFDAFESRKLTYIGPVSSGPTPTPTNTPIPTNTPVPTNTPISTPTFTPTSAPPDVIFADGFESGNLSAWSSSMIDGGDLSASTAARLVGNYGMQAVIDDNNAIYVTDDRPNAEPRYRARFYFDPNTIVMASGNAHYIFYGYSGATVVLRLEFRKSSSIYQLRAELVNDSTTWKTSNWFTISDAPHFVELDWQKSTASGANNGSLTLWIDGVQQTPLTAVDNDTRRIDQARLGAVDKLDTGTRGTYFFDAFESRRQTYIGPAVAAQSAVVAQAETLSNPVPAETDVPITLSSTTVAPGADSRLSGDVAGLRISALLPARTINEPASFVLNQTDNHTMPDGYSLLGGMFELQLAVNGTPLLALEQPLTIAVNYGSFIENMDQSTEVTLQAWDAANDSWTVVPATINAAEQTLTAAVSQPTLLAVFQKDVAATTQIYLPVIQR